MIPSVLNLITPLESPLPSPPSGEVLTDSQWTTLMAIADAVIPSIRDSSQSSEGGLLVEPTEYATAVKTLNAKIPDTGNVDLARTYLLESPSTLPGFKQFLQRAIGDYMREDARKGLRVLLSALE